MRSPGHHFANFSASATNEQVAAQHETWRTTSINVAGALGFHGLSENARASLNVQEVSMWPRAVGEIAKATSPPLSRIGTSNRKAHDLERLGPSAQFRTTEIAPQRRIFAGRFERVGRDDERDIIN